MGGYRCGPGGVAERAERGEGLVHDGAPPAVVRRDLAVAPGEHRGAGRRGAGRRPGQDGAIRTRQFDSAPAELHRKSLLGRFVFALGGGRCMGRPGQTPMVVQSQTQSRPVMPSKNSSSQLQESFFGHFWLLFGHFGLPEAKKWLKWPKSGQRWFSHKKNSRNSKNELFCIYFQRKSEGFKQFLPVSGHLTIHGFSNAQPWEIIFRHFGTCQRGVGGLDNPSNA